MKVLQQIPRNALVWIIFSVFALVLPHVPRLPVWVLLVFCFSAVWRILVYRGRWSFPPWWVKLAMILSACVGIVLSYGTLIGLEPTVALLLTAFALKLIELCQRKDAYVLLFLGYFICITEFLFSQDLLMTLYCLFTVLLVTTALVALHQPGEHQFNRSSVRVAGVMLLQAMPLMVVLFFLFPRFGPLWTVPVQGQSAKTGMSDSMRPGDVARLGMSDDVAFRVRFNGEIPEKSQLYWRGLVFSRFQQGTWSPLSYYEMPAKERRPSEVTTSGVPLTYSVIMEPTQQQWLYALRYAKSTTPGIMQGSEFRLFRPAPLEMETLYRVNSWPDAVLEPQLPDWRRKIETRLPPQGNARARQLVDTLREQAASDQAMVDAVLSRFSQEAYFYTLKPGTLGATDRIDQFLFDSYRGFCEHYASAFVYMMRAADIPARVVAGYQGGEINPVNRTVIVHQFDAHAWAEVWLDGQGWVRVDPTAAVAPDRIEWGLERALREEGSFLSEAPLSPLRYRKIPLLNRLRLEYDALTYRWQSWVVGFNSEEQFDLLQDLLGKLDARKFAAVLLGSWALVLVPVAFTLLRRRKTQPLSPLDKHFLKLCTRLEKFGVKRYTGESPTQFAVRAGQQLPAIAQQLSVIAGLYQELAYAPAGEARIQRQRTFERAVRNCKPKRKN